MKIYLVHWEFIDGGDLRCWFSRSPESAVTWAHLRVAERHRRDFNRHGVIITSVACGTHPIPKLMIEERTDGKPVLVCVSPFLAVSGPAPPTGTPSKNSIRSRRNSSDRL